MAAYFPDALQLYIRARFPIHHPLPHDKDRLQPHMLLALLTKKFLQTLESYNIGKDEQINDNKMESLEFTSFSTLF